MPGVFRHRFELQHYRGSFLVPSKSGAIEVTPSPAVLTLALFAPTVVAGGHQLITPITATLTLLTFAPAVVVNQIVTPGPASLIVTMFAAAVSISDHVTVTPGTATVVLTPWAPSVAVSNHLTVVPGAASLTLTPWAPTIQIGGSVTAEPPPAGLVVTGFPPTVVIAEHETPIIIYGGDDAPRKRRKRTEQAPHAHFFQDIEHTVHRLLHPEEHAASRETPVSVGTDEPERRYDTLVRSAQDSHESLQALGHIRRELDAYLEARRAEEEEEDAMLMLL